MPIIPPVGESTVCEINREYLTQKNGAERHAEKEYSKILGQGFPMISFEVKQGEEDVRGSGVDDIPGTEAKELATPKPQAVPYKGRRSVVAPPDNKIGLLFNQFTAVKDLFSSSLSRWFHHKETTGNAAYVQSLSWHKQKLLLAFIANGDQVFAIDFEEKSKDPYILAGDSQKDVEAIAWRPNAGATLAVACKGGICLWAASYPGSIAPIRSGMVSFLGSSSKPTGARWVLVDYFRHDINPKPIITLSWSPCGRFLASACKDDASFLVWDVALGESTPLRRGLGCVSLLSWSPTGDYLLSCKSNGVFHMWETNTWTSEPWSTAGSYVVSAMWSPDARVLLCAFDRTAALGALHFSGRPPSLDVHLLPLNLPQIDSITGGQGSIDKIAWDGTGERLAVSYTGGDVIHAGLLAVYDTRHVPILTASLLGFIRGPGVGSKPLAFAFHNKLRQGALLAVCWSTGHCCVYPMIFRAY